jgi:hypothetical protein
LAAGYSDIFSRIFTFRFSPRFFPDFCRFHIEIIFITYNGRNVYLYSLTQKTRESESVWRKCVGLTGLFPTCHGGQLTLKLWVTKQGSHPRSIIWIICFRADTGYQSLEHKYTNWLTHRIPYIHYCKVQYIYLYELTNGFWLTEL